MTLAPRSASFVIVGRLALTRPSSVILVPSSGTLRSARSSTPRPATSSVSIPRIGSGQPAADQAHRVGQPVGVAPLVVVPAEDLDLVALGHGQQGVEGARGGR